MVIKAIQNAHEDTVYCKDVIDFTACKTNRYHFSWVYLIILVMLENADCSRGRGGDNPVSVQKLQK